MIFMRAKYNSLLTYFFISIKSEIRHLHISMILTNSSLILVLLAFMYFYIIFLKILNWIIFNLILLLIYFDLRLLLVLIFNLNF